MNNGQKSASHPSDRTRYTWHLLPTFEKDFDRTHWWKHHSEAEIEPIAALYELARRHPRVGDVRSRTRGAAWYGMELVNSATTDKSRRRLKELSSVDLEHEPDAIGCLCRIGLKSWPKLNGREKEYWEDSVGNIKGIDCRDDLERCASIIGEAFADSIIKRQMALKKKCKGKSREEWLRHVVLDSAKKPFPNDEVEAAIAKYAVSAYRGGYTLFAVAGDIKTEEAISLLSKRYREQEKMWQVQPKRRARSENWLPLISEFEDAETGRQKAKSQVFIRYRRVIDLINFTTGAHSVVPTACRHILAVRNFILHEFFKTVAEMAAEKKG